MSLPIHFKCITIVAGLLIVLTMVSCNKVGEDHEINGKWVFVSGQTGTYLSYDSLVTLDIESSTKITGDGPIKNYRGNCEIWKDGSIQISNLCCVDTANGDTTQIPQVDYYGYLSGSTEYEIAGNKLTLRGPNTVMQFEK